MEPCHEWKERGSPGLAALNDSFHKDRIETMLRSGKTFDEDFTQSHSLLLAATQIFVCWATGAHRGRQIANYFGDVLNDDTDKLLTHNNVTQVTKKKQQQSFAIGR